MNSCLYLLLYNSLWADIGSASYDLNVRLLYGEV